MFSLAAKHLDVVIREHYHNRAYSFSSVSAGSPGKFGNLLPITKVHHSFGVRRSSGEPHDEKYYQTIDGRVTGIVRFSGKDRQVDRLRGDLSQQFSQVQIGFGPAFLGLSVYEID